MTSNRTQQALVEFMIEKLGGKDSVYKEFYGLRIHELASQGASLEDLHKEARDGGWHEELANMRLKLLGSAITGKLWADRSEPSKSGDQESATKRLSAEEVADIHDRILTFLETNPWSAKPAIAKGVSVPGRKISARLRALRLEKKIQSSGEKASMRYALASERSKPRV
ncbi:MAG: hypothetical protein RBU30_27785 [Polyangia bacterium]|nr:hypothetical protein [Polyangia bacterium]